MSVSAKEERAKKFAAKAHKGQVYGIQPYRKHLEAVVQLVKEHHLPEETVLAAWLHDIIEDTETTVEDLIKEFGLNIARLVWAVTDDFPDMPRKIRCSKTWMKIKMVQSNQALCLKLCDRIANVEASVWSEKDLIKMYIKEYPMFRKALFESNTHSYTVKSLWERLDRLMGYKNI